ncbi:hypothetical protein BH11MYX3_BH11MYX3_26020 [soil metagenome]
MARTSPRTIAALAITASHVIDTLTASMKVEPAVRKALDLIARSARGEKGLKADLAAIEKKFQVLSEKQRGWRTSHERDYFWAVGAVGALARMAVSGADHSDLVLAHLGYGLTGRKTRDDRIKDWHAAARAATKTMSTPRAAAKPKAAPKKKAAAKKKPRPATKR